MKNRLLICTVTLSLAGTVLALTDTGANAAAKPAASSSAASTIAPTPAAAGKTTATTVPGRTHARALSGAAIAAGLAKVPPVTAADLTVVPHLDPSLNAVAGVAGAQPDPAVQAEPDGTVKVIATGAGAVAAARAVGADVGSDFDGSVALQVPADKLRELAAAPGVTGVQNAVPAESQVAQASGVQSEGVAASDAQNWNTADLGNGGAGVNIAVVDAGFGNLDSEIAAGHFGPASQVVADRTVGTMDAPTANMCGSGYSDTDHGTATSEVVHQMAPNATLYLYCVTDTADFADVVQLILSHNASADAAHKISIASSSLAFPGESRGDGYTTGVSAAGQGNTTTEYAVRAAREHGILWIQSAGNYAEEHWSGTFTDRYGVDANNLTTTGADGYLDFDLRTGSDGQLMNSEFDATILEPGPTATTPSTASAWLTWDQWPHSTTGLELIVQEYDITTTNTCDTDKTSPCRNCTLSPCPTTQTRVTRGVGAAPAAAVTFSNTSNEPRQYAAFVRFIPAKAGAAPPAVRYDLTWGDPASPSFLSGLDASHAARAAGGSVSSPASSPFALAVGAVYVGNTNGTDAQGNPNQSNAGDVPVNALEAFSSRGPTIDGRAKPDLVAYDGVSSNITDMTSPQLQFNDDGSSSEIPGTTGFYGTSAAAPHVAGAAALVLAAHPTMDASQLEAFLEAPNDNDPNYTRAPANNVSGHGRLLLGAADPTKVVPVDGGRYHQVAPTQIASTVTGTGVRKGRLGAGTELTVPVPSSVPADATALIVGLYGKGASGTTTLSLYPTVYTGATTTLNLSALEPNVTITTVVPLSNHAFKLRNNAAAVDAQVIMYGYYEVPADSADTAGDGYTQVAPGKLLDTRAGSAPCKLAPNQVVSVSAVAPGMPADADAAVVNIAALNQTAAGFVSAFPTLALGPHALDYGRYTRDNLVVVPLVNKKFSVVNRLATTDLTITVAGYFSPSGTLRFTALPAPVRLVNTASGNGGRVGPMLNGSVLTTDGGGLNGVPYNATALFLGMTAGGASTGYVAVYPGYSTYPGGQNLDFTASRSVQNYAFAALSARTAVKPPGLATIVRNGTANVYEDVYGYFAPPAN